MQSNARALVARLAEVAHTQAVEIGVGRRPAVAAALADRGVTVVATDVHDRSVPETVQFVRDDVTAPRRSVYAGTDIVYARNLPPELHRPTVALARAHNAVCLFTTLGQDSPVVPVERTQLPAETLFLARAQTQSGE
ncbi:MAG: uncharacterized protein conserved in archaea [halophilic archaeon J07HX5]|nr:MAG: uncharacterized protein conserved in archaea [halophilic archaeon J07HX5]